MQLEGSVTYPSRASDYGTLKIQPGQPAPYMFLLVDPPHRDSSEIPNGQSAKYVRIFMLHLRKTNQHEARMTTMGGNGACYLNVFL
jgi:hypothetical protein